MGSDSPLMNGAQHMRFITFFLLKGDRVELGIELKAFALIP